MRVMVLGGTGFVGRHAAAALRARGHQVLLGTRHPRRALAKLPPALRDCELREIHLESLTTRYVWKPLLAGVEVVVNAAGILRERGGETYDRVHNMAPAALAHACERLGLRLIHVSMLGLRREARSRFLRSKLLAERAIAATGADYCIVRPSLLHGEGGFGADWMRRVARMPVHLYPANAAGRIAALDARDLGEALATLCEVPGSSVPREVELGGSARRTLAGHLRALRAAGNRGPALQIPLPAPLVRLAGGFCDLFHVSPVSRGLLELVRRDNLPAQNLLQALIGRAPMPVGQDLPAPHPAYASRPSVVGRIRFAARELLH